MWTFFLATKTGFQDIIITTRFSKEGEKKFYYVATWIIAIKLFSLKMTLVTYFNNRSI